MTDTNSDRSLFAKEKSFLNFTLDNESGIAAPFNMELEDGVDISIVETGVLSVVPANSRTSPGRKSIVISCGVHGNETAPIEIVDNIVRSILNGKLTVRHRILFLIGNPIAINKGKRFDIENLNRLFNNKHAEKNHHEANRARLLENSVKDFFASASTDSEKLHYDLHTAIRGSQHKQFVVCPFPDGRPWNRSQLEFFLASGINTVLLGHRPAGTFSYYSSHNFQAHAFTVELGSVKPFGENNMAEFEAFSDSLKNLISGRPMPTRPYRNEDFNLFRVKDELNKQSDAFRLNIAEDVKNFTEFKKGFRLADDEDGGYVIQSDGDAIVFPNANVPVGQRAGLIIERATLDSAR